MTFRGQAYQFKRGNLVWTKIATEVILKPSWDRIWIILGVGTGLPLQNVNWKLGTGIIPKRKLKIISSVLETFQHVNWKLGNGNARWANSARGVSQEAIELKKARWQGPERVGIPFNALFQNDCWIQLNSVKQIQNNQKQSGYVTRDTCDRNYLRRPADHLLLS